MKILTGMLMMFSFSTHACDWLYSPAYSVRLNYLQGMLGYHEVRRFLNEEQMIRRGVINEIYPKIIKRNYKTSGEFSEIQLGLLYKMVDDAYLYEPDRDEYSEREYKEVSKDFALKWVRQCSDQIWILK